LPKLRAQGQTCRSVSSLLFIVHRLRAADMVEELEVTILLATTGECLAKLHLGATSTIGDLHRTLSATTGSEDANSSFSFFFGSVALNEFTTLAAAGIHSGDVVSAVRQMHEVQLWCLKAWGSSFFKRGGPLEFITISVPQMSANEICRAALGDEEGGHLLELGAMQVRMFEPHECVSTDIPQVLMVSGAGLRQVNGTYVRDGSHNDFPRWRRRGGHGQVGTWLRKGSDRNWCIVNNIDGLATAGHNKEFYYVSNSPEVETPSWKCDQHGVGTPPSVASGTANDELGFRTTAIGEDAANPHSCLFRSIQLNRRALVAAPTLQPGQRPIVMHVQHFDDETILFAKTGYVDCESFNGMDDEQICILDGSMEAGPALFEYIGK